MFTMSESESPSNDGLLSPRSQMISGLVESFELLKKEITGKVDNIAQVTTDSNSRNERKFVEIGKPI